MFTEHGDKELKERTMPRQFCLGIFWFKFSLLPLPSGREAHFLMIHTKAVFAAVYLDLEFISSPAKLSKALYRIGFTLEKARCQNVICTNGMPCYTHIVPSLNVVCVHTV